MLKDTGTSSQAARTELHTDDTRQYTKPVFMFTSLVLKKMVVPVQKDQDFFAS